MITNQPRVRRAVTSSMTATALALACMAAVPQTHAAGTLMDALTYGAVSAQLRYRYEQVDQEGFAKDAKASTLRTQLGYLTDSYQGFNAFLQFENVTAIGPEHYNSTTNGNTQLPTVSDPTGTEVNQASLAYEAGYGTTFKLGRQVIVLDNQRFVGNVGWRQNEQTFDAFNVVNKSLPDTQITYAYLTDANRITGDDAVNGDLRMKSSLINAAYSGFGLGTFVGYDYLLHNDNQALLGAPSASTQTLGLRFIGKYPLAGATLLYTAEYAKQSDYANNTKDYDETYVFGEFGALMNGFTAKLGYEQLGGDGTYSVQTPLATLHAFNGWADMFLSTPATGLIDQSLTVAAKPMGMPVSVVYHDFKSDHGSTKFGKEWDAVASYAWDKKYTLGLKYADFNGDTPTYVDTKKTWLWAEVKF